MFEGSNWTVEDIFANNHYDRRLTILGIAIVDARIVCQRKESYRKSQTLDC